MRVFLGCWKYIFKNIWFILPFAVIPALFLSLTLNYAGIREYMTLLATGERIPFHVYFCAWSIFRIDSVFGALYSLGAVFSTALCGAVMLSLIEKHMRIGKRSFSGVFNHFGTTFCMTLFFVVLYFVLFELFALILSAVLYAVNAVVHSAVGSYVTSVLFTAVFFMILNYIAVMFYLWFPCMQIGGFRPYEAFRYSYQLMLGIRGRLFLFLLGYSLISLVIMAVCAAYASVIVFKIVMFFISALIFMIFCVQSEALYFFTDKIDRADDAKTQRSFRYEI